MNVSRGLPAHLLNGESQSEVALLQTVHSLANAGLVLADIAREREPFSRGVSEEEGVFEGAATGFSFTLRNLECKVPLATDDGVGSAARVGDML
ncbi:hypothetical protein TZ00_15650 [Agreia bicolorata]|uniref:Uncharacterized protein n=1 Tax=Agreia bicolorata TaxID=110935 RepID=A0ABR5CBY2_9MICO|nr:hypothetical protein TZ00_15650 [Agreia bicolorata]